MKALCILPLFLLSLAVSANSSLPPNRHVVVKGEASLVAKPDLAKVSFEVNVIKPQAIDAKKEVDRRVNLLLAGLGRFQIKEDAVSASNLLTEVYATFNNDGSSKEQGFVATRSMTVTLNNLEMLNDFIDFALSVEINEIDDIELMSSEADKLNDRVNQLAVANAKEKGQSLAKAFDARLGKIYSINSTANRSSFGYGSSWGVERITVTGSRIHATDLLPGRYLEANIRFSASIDVVFDLDVP